MFEVADLNHDGHLTVHEFEKLHGSLSHSKKDHLAKFFEDHHGTLKLSDLVDYFEELKHGERGREVLEVRLGKLKQATTRHLKERQNDEKVPEATGAKDQLRQVHMDLITEVFHTLDVNSDGVLDQEEVEVLSSGVKHIDYFQKMDVNADQMVTLQEMLQWWTAVGSQLSEGCESKALSIMLSHWQKRIEEAVAKSETKRALGSFASAVNDCSEHPTATLTPRDAPSAAATQKEATPAKRRGCCGGR